MKRTIKVAIMLCLITVLCAMMLTSCGSIMCKFGKHTEGEWVVTKEATCYTEGAKEMHCAKCDEVIDTEVIPAHTTKVAGNIEPTCTTSGWTEGLYCTVCEKIIKEPKSIDALGHKYTDNNDDTCDACGYVRSIDCEHLHLDVVLSKAPTCTEKGHTLSSTCADCGEVVWQQKPIDALGHDVVVDAAKAPTCTNTGLTEGSHCSRCDEVLVAQEEVPANGHDTTGRWILGKLPTAEEDGYVYKICGVCGHKAETKVIPYEGSDDTLSELGLK